MSVEAIDVTLDGPLAENSSVTTGGPLAANLLRAGSLLVFALVFLFFSATAPFFLTVGNIGNVIGQSAVLGVLSIGLTLVLVSGGPNVVTGGIDLSLAANAGLSAVVYALVIQAGYSDGTAILAALATGTAIGAVNAVAVVVIGIVPLLSTIAVMNVVAGVDLVLTQNTVIPAASDILTMLSSGSLFTIPALGIVFILFSIATTLVLQFTPLGLRLYATGEFPEAAKAAGLPVRRLTAFSYVAAGFCGGLAGVLSVAYLSGTSTGSGEMLLPVVVTALLGTIFSRRLVPTIPGTVLSTLFVGFLVNGFQLLNLSSTLVSGVQGLLILLVVSATTLLRKQEI